KLSILPVRWPFDANAAGYFRDPAPRRARTATGGSANSAFLVRESTECCRSASGSRGCAPRRKVREQSTLRPTQYAFVRCKTFDPRDVIAIERRISGAPRPKIVREFVEWCRILGVKRRRRGDQQNNCKCFLHCFRSIRVLPNCNHGRRSIRTINRCAVKNRRG